MFPDRPSACASSAAHHYGTAPAQQARNIKSMFEPFAVPVASTFNAGWGWTKQTEYFVSISWNQIDYEIYAISQIPFFVHF